MADIAVEKTKFQLPNNVEKIGEVLLRKGSVIFTWKKTTMALAQNKLYLYQEAMNPKYVIPLDKACEVYELDLVSLTGKGNAFEINSPNQGKFVFSVNSTKERESWLLWIETVCKSERFIPTNPNKGGLKVCSYNVNYAICDMKYLGIEEYGAFSGIKSIDADVVCLQETTLDWETFFTTRLSSLYPYMSFHQEVTHDVPAGGIGVMSKYPLVSINLLSSPVKWFPSHLYVVDSPFGHVQVLNLHLRPPLTNNALPLPHAYYSSKDDRLTECKNYFSKLDLSLPIVVCGDFNESSEGRSCKFWLKNGLKSALMEHDPNTNTWYWPLALGLQAKAQFDHMFYHNLSCKDASVHISGSSDHYPIFGIFHPLKTVKSIES